MAIPAKRRAISFLYVTGSSVLFLTLFTLTKEGGFMWAFLINLVLSFKLVRIPLRIQQSLIPTATCGHCGTKLDLVAMWKCSCGYTLAHPRHAFSPCPRCKEKIGYFNCPKCDSSINLL